MFILGSISLTLVSRYQRISCNASELRRFSNKYSGSQGWEISLVACMCLLDCTLVGCEIQSPIQLRPVMIQIS